MFLRLNSTLQGNSFLLSLFTCYLLILIFIVLLKRNTVFEILTEIDLIIEREIMINFFDLNTLQPTDLASIPGGVTGDFFSVVPSDMCPEVDSASENEYQGFLLG